MDNSFFGKILIDWYLENGRSLPWRKTKDPYLIWISEVILQQTRVVQGMDYYLRFIERFPDVSALATADEEEVLKYWQGLGYYSRARNLHTAARQIVSEFGGTFPQEYREVLSLKGVGEYTAAAICSLAWLQPYAVVDGNVYRVLSRFFGEETPIDTPDGKKIFTALASQLLNKEQPDCYNQAIMDFGAIQCVPQSPDCSVCPFQTKCIAFALGKVDLLPVKKGKVKVKSRYFNYLNIRYRGADLLSKRIRKDIWQNLYEFPLIETDVAVDFIALTQTEEFKELFQGVDSYKVLNDALSFKHILTHRIIYARFYEIEVKSLSSKMDSFLLTPETDMDQYAVSRLIQLYLENR